MMDEPQRVEYDQVEEIAYIWSDGPSIRRRVVELSEHRAVIEVPDARFLRKSFRLSLEEDRITHGCRLVWTSANRIEVEFTD